MRSGEKLGIGARVLMAILVWGVGKGRDSRAGKRRLRTEQYRGQILLDLYRSTIASLDLPRIYDPGRYPLADSRLK